MAPSVKNATTNDLINPLNWNGRVPSVIDSQADFYNKSNAAFKGFVFNSGNYYDTTGAKVAYTGSAYPGTQFHVGPYNEISLQFVGSGAVTVTGSIDGKNFNNVESTTGSDGIQRISVLYRFINISASGLDGTSSLFMQVW